MKMTHLTQDYVNDVINSALPNTHRPRPVHLDCSVCGGSFRSPLSVVLKCEHCQGTGFEPKRLTIDLEFFCSRHPNPGYDREAMYKKFGHLAR